MQKSVWKVGFVSAVACWGLAGTAQADTGNPSEESTTSAVTVVQPITVSRTADLNFGSFVPGGTFADTNFIKVEVGLITYSPPTSFLPLLSDTPHVATFTVTGAPGYEVEIDQDSPVDLQPGALRVTSFVDDPFYDNSFIMPLTGSVSYRVGGKMTVTDASDVDVGTWTVPFVLTVNYN